mgnify:FL=1
MESVQFTPVETESTKNLPVKDCLVNKAFGGCIDVLGMRRRYCKNNCQFRCLRGKDYKKINDKF